MTIVTGERAVFDRYNVVDKSDLRIAARTLENHGRVLDTVAVSEGKTQKPRSLSTCGASVFSKLRGPAFGAATDHVPRTREDHARARFGARARSPESRLKSATSR